MDNHNRSSANRRHTPPKRKPNRFQRISEQVAALHSTLAHDGADFGPQVVLCPCDQMRMVVCFDCQAVLVCWSPGEPCEHTQDMIDMGWHFA